MKPPLYVFCGRDLIGTLHDENGLTLKFSSACIEGFIKNPFENIIPAGVDVISGQRLIAYFENLLPEGAQRMAVEKRFAVSSTFGLLSALSGETIGALTLSRDQSPQTGSYVKSTWKDAVRSVALNNSSDDGRRLQSNMISGQNTLECRLNGWLPTIANERRYNNPYFKVRHHPSHCKGVVVRFE